uniref:endo-polygalacturonase n=1 Tax=Botryotinia fuckeliana TaxID=40559 RepID=A4FRC4_BOTFU|nr:endopolygalacturonase 5 [Botrytis cinerea]
MVKFSVCLLLGGLSALASALPAAAPAPTAAPDLDKRATTCTFSGSGGASSASKSKTSCSTIILSALAVPSGTTLDLTGLTKGTTVIFEGITTFGYEEWSGPLVSVSGTDITVTQTTGAYLDGGGASYWDGEGSNGGKTKPKFFYAHSLISSTIENLYFYNPPVQVMSINSATDLTVSGVTIDAQDGDTDSLGANTDGFDIGSSTTVTITGANVYNQDDCVAINSGTGITFSGGVCSGGHGLSVGSVGGRDDNIVETVLFENSEIKASQNGIRIKTISGDTGTVSGITYSGITLSGITDYGITVNQAYDGTSGEPTNGVAISNFILENITGTVESTATNILIECGSGSCTDWTWTDVSVTGGKTSSSCLNVPTSGGVSCSL